MSENEDRTAMDRAPSGRGGASAAALSDPGTDAWGCPMAVDFVERIRVVARARGYAIAVHGSQQRDLDLVAVPWAVEAVSAQDLVDAICEALGLTPRDSETTWGNPEQKPWGRLGWALDGCPARWRYLDLSVAPRAGEPVPVVHWQRVEVPDGQ